MEVLAIAGVWLVTIYGGLRKYVLLSDTSLAPHMLTGSMRPLMDTLVAL